MSNDYGFNLLDDSFAHSGVLGMKWGQRRYQNEDGTWTEEGKARRRAGESRYFKNNSDMSARKQVTKDAAKGAAQFIAGLAGTTAITVASGGTMAWIGWAMMTSTGALITMSELKKLHDGDKLAKTTKKKADQFDKERESEEIDKNTGLHIKSKEMSMEEDVERVNPEYKNWDANTKNNCISCTAAYEMRRRGYDTTALKDASPEVGTEDWKVAFKNPKTIESKGAITEEEVSTSEGLYNYLTKGVGAERIKQVRDDTEKQLKSAPKSRGAFDVNIDKLCLGHSMAYETDGKGNYKIVDSQTNTIFNSIDEVSQYYGALSRVELTRLDNLKVNNDGIKEFCR